MKKLLVVTLLSAGLSVGCSLMFARTSPLSAKRQTGKSQRPTRGLQITQVFPNSPAERAGLHNTDLITKYGEFEIVDNAGFFAAKNHYKEAHIPSVEIVVWRGLNLMSAQVPSGWVGVDASEYDNTSKAFMSL